MLGAKEDFKTSGEEGTRTDLNGRRVTLTSITSVIQAEVGAQHTQRPSTRASKVSAHTRICTPK